MALARLSVYLQAAGKGRITHELQISPTDAAATRQ
jgi:hypothetical protein